MQTLLRRLYTVAQLRELDRRAIAALDGDGYALMARAGRAAFDELRARWPDARRVAVACGRGNNGGDGYVVGRLARAAGLDARVVRVDEREPGTDDARRARADYLAAGGRETTPAGDALDADLVVDALFGIGLTRAPDAAHAALIDAINAAPAPVLALDVPSGLDADTGRAPGACVDAELTVTFIALKRGLVTGQAARHVGALVLADLDVAAAIRAAVPDGGELIDDARRRALLPPRAPDAHKGASGHVLVVGGELGYGGAARLAAEAALRGGAGLVSLATRGAHVAATLAARPEIMVHGADDLAIDALVARADVVAIGPGLGQGEWGRRAWSRALGAGKPLVVDADALNLLAQAPERLPRDSVITPHPGEAARLLAASTARVQDDRYAAVLELARRYRCVALLKGAGTLVADPDGRVGACPIAEPALASGGTGDVLTGVVAGLRAQGLGPFDAAAVGALVHARAAQRAAVDGARGTLAGDLFAGLRALVNP